MNKKIKIIIALLATWLIIHTLVIVIDGVTDDIHQADVGIVPGNKIEDNGLPSMRLQKRLDRAVELYNNGSILFILVSGAQGAEGFDEADCMRDYLILKSIPAKNILVDNYGYNTAQTAINSRKIMEDNHLASAIIITQYFHISRAKLALKKSGIKEVYSAHAYFFEPRDIYSIFREFFGYYKYLLMSFN